MACPVAPFFVFVAYADAQTRIVELVPFIAFCAIQFTNAAGGTAA
jgi:hypothetical protein